MFLDVNEFEKRVEQGFLRKSVKGDLVLYGYTDKCTYERAWDEYTRMARGIILDKNTGEVIAKPFPKFFNLGEMEETFLTNLPKEPYVVAEKMDGSLGIIFHHDGKWNVATRGSFYSDQAAEAERMLQKYNLSEILTHLTILVEIIYPENKIIVNYGAERKLVVLGMYSREDGTEINTGIVQFVGWDTGMECPQYYNYTIEEMIELQTKLPKDNEGFVVRFRNGLRVKIKGKEYLRIAKLMANLSPLALFETMKNGKVDQFYLQQLPEELKADYEPYMIELERQYEAVLDGLKGEVQKHKLVNDTPTWRKDVGMYLANNKVNYSGGIFPYLLDNKESLDSFIMKQIRPTGNEMRLDLHI